MSTNILKNAAGTQVKIATPLGDVSPKIATLGAIPGPNSIVFTAQGMGPLIVAYSDLKINSVQVYGKTDAIAKLKAYLPDIIISSTEANTLDVAPKRFLGIHLVMSLFHLDYTGSSVVALVQGLKDCGINVLWLFNDDYDPANAYFKTNTLAVIAACAAVGSIWASPGLLAYTDTGANTYTKKQKNLITDTFYLDGMFKMDGKPVYMQYGFVPYAGGGGLTYNELAMQALLLKEEGIHKKNYLNLIHMLYSYSYSTVYDGTTVWEGEGTSGGMTNWSTKSGFFNVKPNQASAYKITDADHELSVWNNTNGADVGGFVNFGVDMPLATVIADNMHKIRVAKYWKLAGGCWASFAGFYASFSFFDYGFSGLNQIWDPIISLPIEDRPIGMMGITGNDDVEYSRCTPLPGFVNGLKYLPSIGTWIGPTLPTPVIDRRGIIDYLKPNIDTFLNDKKTVVYTKNAIFYWYMLHPKTAAFISVIPSAMVDVGYTQGQWDTSIYKIGSGTITGIKALANVDDLKMAVHLVEGTYKLKINTSLSGLITIPAGGGVALYSIALGAFRGTPHFAIYAADGTTLIMQCDGEQDITDLCWPGGWGPLIKQGA